MFEKFGEFDSAEELNLCAEGLKQERDTESLIALAVENGLDREDAEDYIDGAMPELATPLVAALGKIKVEGEKLKLSGVLTDWKDTVVEMCMDDSDIQIAVRRKGKNLKDCLAAILKYAFENKEQVSEEIVKACKVMHNGKLEQMRSPLYLGVPSRKEVRKIVKEYYTGKAAQK